MKRYLVAFFVLLSSVAISQDIANHSIPIGGGPNAVGWKTGGPCSAGQALVWAGAGVDPSCTSVSGSGSTPGGANGAIQYNNAGTFGGITVGTGLVNSGTALNCVDATGSVKGCVQTDGATISVAAGVISCRTGTAAVKGCLQADGTTITVAAGVISAAPQATAAAQPGGRLVLNNAACGSIDAIQLTDIVANGGTICYVPYLSNVINIAGTNYTFSTLSLALNSSHQLATFTYDIWAVVITGAAQICVEGNPWAGAFTTPATRKITKAANGQYENSGTVLACYNGSSSIAAPTAGNARYLGSVYITTDGNSQWILNPAVATGGTANVMGLYNAYNRVRAQAIEREATPNWTYNTATWRCVQNSCNNKIMAVDGLGLSRFEIDTLMTIDTGDNNVNGGTTNVCFDCSPAGTPGSGPLGGLTLQVSNQAGFDHTSQGQTLAAKGFYTGVGLHTFTFIEIGGGGTATEWFGNTFSGMYVTLEN